MDSGIQKTEEGFDMHVCRGLNECKGQGKNSSGSMAGDGTCSTAVAHGCSGSESCKGQSGCGKGPAENQEHPGENEAKGQGGCAVPITTAVMSAGKYEGRPVWEVARELFEARMKAKGVEVGAAPTSDQQ